ncbi:mutator type transposase [Tanacetum coccineum]
MMAAFNSYSCQVDVDLFSIVDLNDMLEILGYKKRSGIYYHYKIPDSNLDFGLKELRNDQDVLNLISQTTNHKLIEIYCEHENTDLEVVFEESTPMTSNIGTVNKRAAKKSSRLPLLLMGDESEANDDSIKEKYVEMENDEDNDIDKDVSSDMEVSSDSEDSDWVDEEHILNEVEVDMKDFFEYTDKDVEWTGCNKGNTEIPIEDFVPEFVDLDDFHSASESDTELEGRRKKALRKLRKEHEQGQVVDNTKPFYVGVPVYMVRMTKTDLSAVSVKWGKLETLFPWSWFLTCLGDDLDLTRDSNFTFISDRQKGLIPALAQVFPCAEHRFCLRHIHENMKGQFRGRAHCDMLLNNICEVFNRRLVDGRDAPIITCLEFVREYLRIRDCITDEASFYKHAVASNCGDRAGNKVSGPLKVGVFCLLLAGYMEKGRPPKKRKKSADELSSQKMTEGGKLSRAGKTVTCDTCKTPGHNKRSCKRGMGVGLNHPTGQLKL